MSRPSNGEIEKYYFKKFIAHYSLPQGEIEYGDKPDVIIHGIKTIGIEMSNLYLSCGKDNTSEQVQRERRNTVLEKAQTLYESKSNLKHEFTVSFDPKNPILNANAVSSRLVDFAVKENWASRFYTGKRLSHIPEVYSVFRSDAQYPDAKWKHAQVYDWQELSVPRLRELVSQKNGRISVYKPCDCYWLLLVVDYMDPAQDQDINWPKGTPPHRISLRESDYLQSPARRIS
jgi:hypothetical protein